MLAQNFKSAEELGLTEKGYRGLIKVLGMLEREELVHSPEPYRSRIPNGFNMRACWNESACGTVGCIGGWAGFYNNRGWVAGNVLPGEANLHELFCPIGYDRSNYTVEQAAHALRTYLVTGHAEWA